MANMFCSWAMENTKQQQQQRFLSAPARQLFPAILSATDLLSGNSWRLFTGNRLPSLLSLLLHLSCFPFVRSIRLPFLIRVSTCSWPGWLHLLVLDNYIFLIWVSILFFNLEFFSFQFSNSICHSIFHWSNSPWRYRRWRRCPEDGMSRSCICFSFFFSFCSFHFDSISLTKHLILRIKSHPQPPQICSTPFHSPFSRQIRVVEPHCKVVQGLHPKAR